ncbi:MAG: hypothetical protein HDR24_13170 [Lachnospiraceae bacterium]|nr:hypothetical protein [Lachnospiraceae bacterium]
MNGELIAKQYPIGAKVRLVGDSHDEAPREVAGYKNICGFNYLIFTDGYMAYVERVVG